MLPSQRSCFQSFVQNLQLSLAHRWAVHTIAYWQRRRVRLQHDVATYHRHWLTSNSARVTLDECYPNLNATITIQRIILLYVIHRYFNIKGTTTITTNSN